MGANSKSLVYIIDDEPDICRSLAMLLAAEDFDARTFTSVHLFLGSLAILPPGVVVTDVRMPVMDGIELMEAMAARDREDPVIVMTGHADLPLAIRALRAGAADFIEKPFAADAIVSAIRRCAQPDHSEARDLFAALTKREVEVFTQLVDGASNKQIAINLGISPRTVEIHRASVMDKMHANSLSRLVRLGLEVGLAHD